MSTIVDPANRRSEKVSRKAQPLERVSLNLTPKSAQALDRAVELTEDSKTDTINRAIQTYAFLMEVIDEGGSIRVQRKEGDVETVHFL